MIARNVLALVFLFCLALTALVPGRVQAAAIPATLPGSHASLLPWLDYHIDESGTDVEEIAANELQLPFARFDPMQPIRSSGTFWLRFTLAPREAGQKAETWMLDMGESIPGKPVLYRPTINPLSGAREWQEVHGGDRHVFLLPEAGLEPLTCYIRLSGAPGIWFSPMLRTPHDAANNWKTMGRYAVLVALCAVMLFCLLRSGGGQWRVWTGLFAAAALAQGLMGLPVAENGRMGFQDLPVVLLPGLALMLLPHAGRHLMHTEVHSRSVDYQLFGLTMVGAAVALVPLYPGMAWLSRYLDLWPLATACFLVTALVAVFLRLKGSKRFLLACFLPPAATLAGIMAATVGVDPEIAGACPMLGVTLSTLALATSRSAIISAVDLENATINLERPLDDPNLRIVQPSAPAAVAAGGEGAPQGSADGKTEHLLANSKNLLLEDALRLPLDRLMREGAALGRCSLPPAVRQYSENMLEQARNIADIISHPTHQPESKATPEDAAANNAPFNLQQLMREAHDTVAPLAESANIGLAWYMPPHLAQMYKGSGQALQETLCMLLESSVRATMHGAVHFSVRRVPESDDAGHLLFTITDTGSGMPPRDRSSLALSRAWELAGAHKGYLGVESSPRGATIAFTLHLECMDQEEAENMLRRKPLVLICAESAVERQSLGHMLSGLGCRTISARTMNEALQLHKGARAVLFIAHGDIALKAEIRHIQQIQEQSSEEGMPQCHILAITPDESRWKVLKQLGFSHALAEPVAEEDLRHTVQEILDKYAAWQESQQQAAEQIAEQADGFAPVAGSQSGESKDTASEEDASNGASAPEVAPTNPLPGQPLLPNLLHSTGKSQQSPMQIPDLTALPDLLHFAESMGKSTSKRPAATETDTVPSTSMADGFGSLDGLLPPLGGTPEPLHVADAPDAPEGTETAESANSPDMGGMPTLVDFETTVDKPETEATSDCEPVLNEPELVMPNADESVADESFNDEFMAAGGFGSPDGADMDTAQVDEPGPNTRGFTPPDDQIDAVLMPEDGDDGVVIGTSQPVTSRVEEMPNLADSFEPLSFGNEPAAPVAAPEAQAEQEAAKTAFDTFGEWVGEPTPYIPKAEPEDESASEQATVPAAEPAAPRSVPASEAVVESVPAATQDSGSDITAETKPEPKIKTVARISLRPLKRSETEIQKKADGTQASDTAAPATPARATIRLRPNVRPKIELKPVAKPVIVAEPEVARREDVKAAETKNAETTQEQLVETAITSMGRPESVTPTSDAPEIATVEPATTETTQPEEPVKPSGNDNFMDFFADMEPAPTDPPADEDAESEVIPPVETSQNGLSDREVAALLERLDTALIDTKKAFEHKDCAGVADAAGRIVTDCGAYGLHVLGGIAGCVERAAQANDLGALHDLLPDLYGSVERNRISFSQTM